MECLPVDCVALDGAVVRGSGRHRRRLFAVEDVISA